VISIGSAIAERLKSLRRHGGRAVVARAARPAYVR